MVTGSGGGCSTGTQLTFGWIWTECSAALISCSFLARRFMQYQRTRYRQITTTKTQVAISTMFKEPLLSIPLSLAIVNKPILVCSWVFIPSVSLVAWLDEVPPIILRTNLEFLKLSHQRPYLTSPYLDSPHLTCPHLNYPDRDGILRERREHARRRNFADCRRIWVGLPQICRLNLRNVEEIFKMINIAESHS